MNVLEQFLTGRAARREQDAADQVAAMNTFLQQQGGAIFGGDQNALAKLSGMGPQGLEMAFNVQGQVDQRQRAAATDQRAVRADERAELTFQREMEDYAKGISAKQAAAEAAQVERAVKGAMMAETPQQFDAMMEQLGQPELKGQFANREALAAQYMPIAEVLKMRAGAGPDALTKGAPTDTMWVDPNDPRKGVVPIPGVQPKQQDPYSAEAKLKADLDAGRIDQQTYEMGLSRLAPRGTSITTDPTTGAITFTEGVGVGGASVGGGSDKQVYDTMEKSAEAAKSAVQGLAALQEAEKALEGGAITGFAANQRLSAAKLGALVGVTDPAIITNTETFRSAIAPQVSAMIKATVGSTQISNSDREFAEKAAGGSIELDEATIKRLIGIMKTASGVIIDRHNSKLETVYPDPASRERALFSIGNDAGQPPPPSDGPKTYTFNPETGELE